MGDKNAPQGLSHKLFSPRYRMKLLLPFCLLVAAIVWSSSSLLPFNAVTESRVFLHQCASCGQDGTVLQGDQLDAVGASTTLQLKVLHMRSRPRPCVILNCLPCLYLIQD
jgi:hypothetical protein